jgi:hypothetical protein
VRRTGDLVRPKRPDKHFLTFRRFLVSESFGLRTICNESGNDRYEPIRLLAIGTMLLAVSATPERSFANSVLIDSCKKSHRFSH